MSVKDSLDGVVVGFSENAIPIKALQSERSPRFKKIQKNNRPHTAVNLKQVYKTNTQFISSLNNNNVVQSINCSEKYNNIFNSNKNYENLIKKQASNEHFNRHLAQIGENSSGYNAYFNRTNVNALQKAVMPLYV